MKQLITNVLVTIVFVSIFALIPVSTTYYAHAQTSTTTTTTSSGDRVQSGLDSISSAYPDTVVTKDSTLASLAKKVIDVALYVSAMLAVLFIIYGGYQYIFSAGNDETAKSGRKTLFNALIGLAIIVLSYIIVQVVYRFLTNQT